LPDDDAIHEIKHVSGMYESWFLDYASYVILERAVPAIGDGLKPVQRRIMHAMKELDDGRFNKVANIIGSTMQYHPHGDASIGDAIVNLGQKELLIDTQGNWGDIRTGDSAAAPRYIEARLSRFALEVLYNPQTTEWQLSYDGRKKEPVTFPVKFPLLLAQGVEGIAVGLSTKILPHNFCELIKGSIDILKGKKVKIYPDFPTGGMADFTDYNEGMRGGKVRVRAKIEEFDKKTLIVKDIPYGTTTTGLIESVIKANDKGKIKIKKVVDNTAQEVEILISLAPGQSPDITIDALYAFTDCEVSISPNSCVIIDDKPVFLSVDEILKFNTDQTVDLLKRELEIRKEELLEKILFSSLEKIFIENRIYRDIEECETWEGVIQTIDAGLEPFKKQFYREITEEDIVRLTEIKIKRISKFDSFKADELLKKLEEELKETERHLDHIIDYSVSYFEKLLEKYGKGKERKTEIKSFENIQATVVAANNAKLYVNRAEGFIGYGMRKDEFVCECSDLDDIIAFRRDGVFKVVKIAEKVFVGKDIIHLDVFRKNDERMVYNAVYLDGKTGRSMVKRFQVLGVTREKEYDVSKSAPGSKVLYFSANPNGEAEVITVHLSSRCRARIKTFDYDFTELEIKGRGAGGNILTKYPVRKIEMKSQGVSTLGGLEIYYDDSVGRLNKDGRGKKLGIFNGDESILTIYNDGTYELTNYELTNRYDEKKIMLIEKFDPESVITCIYYDGENKVYYLKRFQLETTTLNKSFLFITESRGSKLEFVSTHPDPVIEYHTRGKKGDKDVHEGNLSELIDVKGWKAIGNKFTSEKVFKIIDKTDNGSEEVRKTNKAEDTKKKGPEDKAEQAEKKLQDKEQEASKKESKSDGNESYDVGDTIDLDIDPNDDNDQLDLFDK